MRYEYGLVEKANSVKGQWSVVEELNEYGKHGWHLCALQPFDGSLLIERALPPHAGDFGASDAYGLVRWPDPQV